MIREDGLEGDPLGDLDLSTLGISNEPEGERSLEATLNPLQGNGGIPTAEELGIIDDEEEEIEEPAEPIKEGEEEPEEPEEDEEEEKVPKGPKDLEDEEEEEEIPADNFNVMAEFLKESGVVDEIPEDFDPSEEGLSKLVDSRIESEIEEYKENLPPEIKYMLENYEEGVNLQDLIQREAAIAEYSSIDNEQIEDNEDLQKALVKDFLGRTGYDEVETKEKLEELEAAGLLEKEAKRSQKKLVAFEEKEKKASIETQKQRREEARFNYETQLKDLKKDIESREEILPGLTLTDKDKKALYEGITKAVAKDENGRPINAIAKFKKDNPDFDLMMAYVAVNLKGDFSKLTTNIASKAKKEAARVAKGRGTSPKKRVLKGFSPSIAKKALR